MGLWTVASTCSTWRERCQNVPYGKWPYITTTALSMIRSFWLHGQARYGIVVEIAITSALSLINTFRSGGRAWVVLAEFYHLLFANVVRLCTKSYPNSTSLLVILMYRREPSLHLNPRAEWIWWSFFFPFPLCEVDAVHLGFRLSCFTPYAPLILKGGL